MASSRGASAGTSAVITSDLSFPSLTSKEEEVYSQFVHQTYDLPPAMEEGSPENEDDASECEDISDASTLWEFINFFPIFLQSMAAITNLLHSLVLGNAAQWSISSLTAPLTSPGWVGPAPVGVAWILATDANGKVLDWPPPALIGLALLTIIALMVHPDGFTWILLRKLRSGMVALLQSLATWWALIVDDYGTIISSIVALATFASLFFVAYALHKTLSPRGDARRQIPAEKQKKKKRRGNNHARGNRSGGRIKGVQEQLRTKSASIAALPPEPELGEASISIKKDLVVEGKENDIPLPALVEDIPLSPLFLPASVPSPERLAKALKEDTAPSRIRATSYSTVDTGGTLSDDQSCGTVSGRSTPTSAILLAPESVPVVSAITVGRADKDQILPWATSSRKQANRRGKKNANVDVSKAPASRPAPVVSSSRWDALKPSPSRSVGADRRVAPKGRPGPPHVARGHSLQSRSNYQPPHPTPIARPTFRTPTLSPVAEPTRDSIPSIPGFDLVVPQEILSPSAASLQSCEIGASTWSHAPTRSYEDFTLAGLPAPFMRSPTRGPVPETYFASPLRTGDQTSFFSELDAKSPSWLQTTAGSSNTFTAPNLGPVRAPPGLTLADEEWDLQPSSSFPQATIETPFLSTYHGLSLKPLHRFSMPSQVSCVKENPFDENDDDENDDQIEAELQELGGQMVGSILDF